VVLSRDGTLSSDDIVLAGSVVHAGVLAMGDSYNASATLTLPRDLAGDYYILVVTNLNGSVYEKGHTTNNVASLPLKIGLAPVANLAIDAIDGPSVARPGDTIALSYIAHNSGNADANGTWRDRIYLETQDGTLVQVASNFYTDGLAAGASATRNVSFTLPANFVEGSYTWVVNTDTDNTVYERDGESDNMARGATPLTVARPDLAVSTVTGPSLAQSGSTIHVDWTVTNHGGLAATGWVDRVYVSHNGVLTLFGEVGHAGTLATGASYTAGADLSLPLAYDGEYAVVVVTDAAHALDEHSRTDDTGQQALTVQLAPHADLVVGAVQAPTTLIADPATLDVSWTVTNQGTGAGITSQWTDKVILSTDDVFGDGDDRVLGTILHDGALAVGDSYTGHLSTLLPPGTTGHYKLFVVTDSAAAVFENGALDNNVLEADHAIDVMPRPYADL
jgi:hypothetical protein